MDKVILCSTATIKKAFCLNDQEADQLFTAKKDNCSNNLFTLYTLAKEWLELGYPSDRESIFSTSINGETIYQALSTFNKEKILFMGRYLIRQRLDENLL